MAGPSQPTYLTESSAEMSAECSRQLATLRKKAVHRRNQESKKRTRKSSKVESTYWRVFTLSLFCTVLRAHTKPATLTSAMLAPPVCAMCIDWRMACREASYTCVVLVYINRTIHAHKVKSPSFPLLILPAHTQFELSAPHLQEY